MEILLTQAKTILTPQRAGFLASGPYPFTHALSAYTGCAYGNTTCGMYCYAQHLPNWTFNADGAAWGQRVIVKENAPQLLDRELRMMRPETRRGLRIFMSSVSDPYQPAELEHRITRNLLDMFRRWSDLDLLLIQTRSPLVTRDLEVLADIPYAWLSMTIETDDPAVLKGLKGGPPLGQRWEAVEWAVARGISTQITVSPCLPHTPAFADRLEASGALRIVVDTPVDGDGSGGRRTGLSPWGQVVGWNDREPALELRSTLLARGVPCGWSVSGFCGIPPRPRPLEDARRI